MFVGNIPRIFIFSKMKDRAPGAMNNMFMRRRDLVSMKMKTELTKKQNANILLSKNYSVLFPVQKSGNGRPLTKP